MALGRKYISVARANGGTDVFCLARLLRDDNLIGHGGIGWEKRDSMCGRMEHNGNIVSPQATGEDALALTGVLLIALPRAWLSGLDR